MKFRKLLHAFFSWCESIGCLTSTPMLGILVMLFCLYGCASRRISESSKNTDYMALNELNVTFKPHNRSAAALPMGDNFFLNSLISEFGDIPEVQTYVTLQQKLRNKERFTLDDIIALASVNLYLYPSEAKAEELKKLKEVKRMSEAKESSGFFVIYMNLAYGDHIEVHYPDGSKKVSVPPGRRTAQFGVPMDTKTQTDEVTPEVGQGRTE